MSSREIIMNLGKSEYLLWLYLKDREFKRPSIDEMVKHFGRHSKTIRIWLKRLEQHGYI